jgi:hypothetical protein
VHGWADFVETRPSPTPGSLELWFDHCTRTEQMQIRAAMRIRDVRVHACTFVHARVCSFTHATPRATASVLVDLYTIYQRFVTHNLSKIARRFWAPPAASVVGPQVAQPFAPSTSCVGRPAEHGRSLSAEHGRSLLGFVFGGRRGARRRRHLPGPETSRRAPLSAGRAHAKSLLTETLT